MPVPVTSDGPVEVSASVPYYHHDMLSHPLIVPEIYDQAVKDFDYSKEFISQADYDR